MTELSQHHCEACRIDAPRATPEEIASLSQNIPDWELIQVEGVDQLRRCFSFKDFDTALEFANRVGALAESEGHHPALLVEWGQVTVSWWSHKIRGLHRNDFIMAAKTDRLLAAF